MEQLAPFYVVLAAGGVGTRMGTATPKQYLPLYNKPLALYSFEVFLAIPEVMGIVVVCDPAYHCLFTSYKPSIPLSFAKPGRRRQDSIFNGIEELPGDPLVCIHDAARPLVDQRVIRQAVQAASESQAAVVGVPVKATIKLCDAQQHVISTPDREQLWEIQTPQVIRLSLLKQGFAHAQRHHVTVTDDASLVELFGTTVKVVEGSYSNIKVTTPEDLALLEQLICPLTN